MVSGQSHRLGGPPPPRRTTNAIGLISAIGPSRQAPAARGFTLVEILVALAVTAIALLAGMQASGALTRLSERQSDQLLAQLCADNELAKVRLSRQLPGAGRSDQPCTQAGIEYRVAVEVMPTPNPNFRRVDVRVHPTTGLAGTAGTAASSRTSADTTLLQVSTVVGRY